MSDHDTWNMFAAAAAQGMCAYHGSYGLNNGPGEIAARAYDIADALLAESKKRETQRSEVNFDRAPEPTPPQPDDDGWIKWEGGECPVPHGTLVDLRHGDGDEYLAVTAGITNVATRWDVDPFCPHPGDIRAYRIVSEAGVTK